MHIQIRQLLPSEYYILEDMLYEAIFQPDENNLIPREIINLPEIYVFIDKFGEKKDDLCLVAEVDGKIAGAVWTRILSGEIKGFGNIDGETPEFAISLYKEYRNYGIGTQLMQHMISLLRERGYKQTSLHVQKENYAVKMYLKLGFEIIHEDEEGYLMLLKL